MKARIALPALAALLLFLFVTHAGGAPSTIAGCAPSHAAGEWTSYGGDDFNSRSQPAETVWGPGTFGTIGRAWTFRLANAEYLDPATSTIKPVLGGGVLQNTPVVADGCVFLATSTGWILAFNADTGPLAGSAPGKQRVLWANVVQGSALSLRSGVITGSPLVRDGVVYVGVTRPGNPYVAALDAATGAKLWESVVENQPNAGIAASPVAAGEAIFQGWYGSESNLPGSPSQARGGYALLDATRTCDPAAYVAPNVRSGSVCHPAGAAAGGTGGTIKAHTYTITDAEWAAGYKGASVWCTAAYDPATRHVYACGGNPANPKQESRWANSLLKIDADPGRAQTFGKIVGSYKGQYDQYVSGVDQQPACDNLGDQIVVVWSIPCLQLDLDFGSSPNVFKVKIGTAGNEEIRTVVGALQKSGVYHAVWADEMSRAWSSIVGVPCAACNASSTAYDTDAAGMVDKVYVAAAAPGQMFGLNGVNGRYRWAAPIGGGTHFQSVTVANNLVYTVDNLGTLHVFDADLGVLVARRVLAQDTGAMQPDASSQGVAVARNTIYVANADAVIALR